MTAKKKSSKRRKQPQKPPETPEKTREITRKYPYLTDQQEKAVILRASHCKYAEIARQLNRSEYTVSDWFKNPDVKKALEEENNYIISVHRDSFGKIIASSYQTVRETLDITLAEEDSILKKARLAFDILKDTGYLPKSASQSEKEKVIEDLVKRITNTIGEN